MRRPDDATSLFLLIATSHAVAVLAGGLPFKTTGTGTLRVANDPFDDHGRILKKAKGKKKVSEAAPSARADPAALFIRDGDPLSCCTGTQHYFCKYATAIEEKVGKDVSNEEASAAIEATPAADKAPAVEVGSAAETTPEPEAATTAKMTPEIEAQPEAEVDTTADVATEFEAEPQAEAAPAAEAAKAQTHAEMEEKKEQAELEGQVDEAHEVKEDAVAESISIPGGGRRAASAVIDNDGFASKEDAYVRRGKRIAVKGTEKSGSLGLDTRGLKGKGKGKGEGESKGGKGEEWDGAEPSKGAESLESEVEESMDDVDKAGKSAVQEAEICREKCDGGMDNSWAECSKDVAMKADKAQKERAANKRDFSAAESAPEATAERLSAGYAALIGLSGLVVLVVAFLVLRKRRSSNQGEMMMLDKDLDDDTGTDVMSSNGNVGVLNEVAVAEEDNGGFEFQLGNNRLD